MAMKYRHIWVPDQHTQKHRAHKTKISKKYPLWRDVEDLWQEYNCHHTYFGIILGVTEPQYNKKELNEFKNAKVILNGKKVPYYEATQKQRQLENKIRHQKRTVQIKEKSGLDTTTEKAKLRQMQKDLTSFCKETGLEKDYSRMKIAKSNLKKTTQNAKISKISKDLDKLNVEYNPVNKLKKKLSSNEIIQKIAGGDKTKGSCSSVAFAYIANRNGLDVLDFRGGESQNFFSTPMNINRIAQIKGIKSTIEENYNDIMGAMSLLNKVKENKEYYLSTGEHAAIIRKKEGKIQYLELQDKENNGFKQFTNKTLKDRFHCKQTHIKYGQKLKAKSTLIEVDSFKDNEEFKEVMGYINTQKEKQLKGNEGYAK